MGTTDVVVVGAGPTGLMLACELALGKSGVQLLEERTSNPNITRAFAVHARTLELLDARGLAEDLLPRGVPIRELAPPGGATTNLGALNSRFGMLLIVPQSGTEQVLQSRASIGWSAGECRTSTAGAHASTNSYASRSSF
nr:FAD-dependent monooxygenase [Mycolicibacterium komanii]CRL69340.1 2-polyprenyl-6-methoxyphenol hydroxylase-like oxidoreductase [Mycolicibacterium komanii]